MDMRIALYLILFALFAQSCTRSEKETNQEKKKDTVAGKSASGDVVSEREAITSIGREALVLLKTQNYPELIKYFSPNGVRFSPYGYIDTAHTKMLSAADFLTAINKNWVLTWGQYDGTGKPIKLTVREYLSRFVYNADFLNAEAVGYDEAIKSGNSINNVKVLYPECHYIDYHFSGFDQEKDGMDWTSLRLVFEKDGAEYFIAAIVHDQWTI